MSAEHYPDIVFDVVRPADFPRLGWLFRAGQQSTLYCGQDVEVFDRGAVEGCWDGSFKEFDFAGRINFFGSGLVVQQGAWWFCPPCHTLDPLFALILQGQTCVANSLPLLLAHTGLHLDPRVPYTRRLGTVVSGLDAADTMIWRDDDLVLYRVLADDFTIVDGDLRRRRKTETASFSDFASYRRHLIRTLAACRDNARDPARGRTYHLLSTCSGGYDSNTVTALSAEVGGERAITLRSARGGGIDSGRQVAETLGLACVEKERSDDATGGAEVEFLTPGMGGGDYPLGQFQTELDGALLLTGYQGGRVWERTGAPNSVLQRTDSSGCSLANFRLRLGFLHIPVPFIGARRQPEIQVISNADEMRPFSIGGTYDRPICRRILEEAGVPRELVGRSKQFVSTNFSWSPRYLSPEVRAAFEEFLRTKGLLRRTHLELAVFQAAAMGFRAVRKTTKKLPFLERPLGGLRDALAPRFRALENSSYANLLFIWAVEQSSAGKMRPAYSISSDATHQAVERHHRIPTSGAPGRHRCERTTGDPADLDIRRHIP